VAARLCVKLFGDGGQPVFE